jgi:hypothetical protein
MTRHKTGINKMSTSWTTIKNDVIHHGNVLTLPMTNLRDTHGASKLGATIIEEISRKLNEVGLGHIPEILPSTHTDRVRLYLKDSPIGKLMGEVVNPSPENDTLLKERVSHAPNHHADIIRQIHELVKEN